MGRSRRPASSRVLRRAASHCIEGLLLVMMVALCVDVFLGVFSRYVLRSTFTWYDEIARLLFVWMVFLGAAVGVRQTGHFQLHELPARSAPRHRAPGRARHHPLRGRARAAGMEARGA